MPDGLAGTETKRARLRASGSRCPKKLSPTLERTRGRHHGFDRDAEFLERLRRRRAETEAIDANDFSVETDELAPQRGDARFDSDARTARTRQNAFAVFRGLAIETFERRHRDDAGARPDLLRGP